MRELVALTVASVAALVICTYLLRLPQMLLPRHHHSLITEYYGTGMYPNVLLDVGFIIAYLAVPLWLQRRYSVSNSKTLVAVAVTGAVLTATICFLFRNASPPSSSNNFFARWFRQVGYTSVVYDTFLVTFTFALYCRLLRDD